MTPLRSSLGRFVLLASRHPFGIATILLLVLTVPTLGLRDLWLPDETRHAAVLQNMVDKGHWLVLYLGNTFYADKPPVFFWLAALIAIVSGSTAPFVLIVATWLSALAFLAATIFAGRVYGFGRRTILLAVLLLFSNWFFIERVQAPRMDLLFAAFIALAHASLFLASERVGRDRLLWCLVGFGAASLSLLTKGPVGPLLVFLTLIVFLARRQRLSLLLDRGFLTGMLLFVLVTAAYLAGVILSEGFAFVRAVMVDQTLTRAFAAIHLRNPFYYYLHKIPEVLLPWSIVLLFLPWQNLANKSFWLRLVRPHPNEKNGFSYCATGAIVSLIAISSFQYKITFLLLTFYPQLVLLAAYAILRLARQKARYAQTTFAATLFVVSLVLPFAPTLTLWPDAVHGEGLVAAGLFVGSILLLTLRGAPSLRFAFAAVFAVFLAVLPLYVVTVPGLNAVMSPRAQAAVLAHEMRNGQPTFYIHPYRDGIYDYHAGAVVPYLRSLDDLRRRMSIHQTGVVAMPRPLWEAWTDPSIKFEIIDERRIDADIYVVVRWRS